MSAQYCTFDQVNSIYSKIKGNGSLQVANSILTSITNSGSGFTTLNNATNNIGTAYETAGLGTHYLVTNSIYRDMGTTNVNSNLLISLGKKTTTRPVTYSNTTISNNLVLAPNVELDAVAAPDLGYHYNPVDYVMTNCNVTSSGTLILTNGVVVALYGTNGLTVSGSVISQGSPLHLNRLVACSVIQEQPWSTPSVLIGGGGAWATLDFRFTDFSLLDFSESYAGPGFSYAPYLIVAVDQGITAGPVRLRDCQLRGAGLYCLLGYVNNSAMTISLTNNLFERSAVSFFRNAYMPDQLAVSACNNSFYGGSVDLSFYIGEEDWSPPNWYLYNNFFDSSTLSQVGSSGHIIHGYNGYVNTTPLSGSVGGDVETGYYSYDVGPLGKYYCPSWSSMANAGSTTANQVGLYHYTTKTNQVKEGNSTLDIGYHYVALDSHGNPVDLEGDGVSDYLEDANGNGVVDTGESSWLLNAYNGLSVGAGLKVFTPLK